MTYIRTEHHLVMFLHGRLTTVNLQNLLSYVDDELLTTACDDLSSIQATLILVPVHYVFSILHTGLLNNIY